MKQRTRQAIAGLIRLLRVRNCLKFAMVQWKVMQSATEKLLIAEPIARLRCVDCGCAFKTSGAVAELFISKLVFFAGLRFGDHVKVDCPKCGSTSAAFVGAGYSMTSQLA